MRTSIYIQGLYYKCINNALISKKSAWSSIEQYATDHVDVYIYKVRRYLHIY